MEKLFKQSNILRSTSEISSLQRFPILNNPSAEKITETVGNINRRIDFQSTVSYYKQEYLEDDKGDLFIINNDYKNKKKIDLQKCSFQESHIREIMLEAYDESSFCVIFREDYSNSIKEIIKSHVNLKNKRLKKEYLEDYSSVYRTKAREEEFHSVDFKKILYVLIIIDEVELKISLEVKGNVYERAMKNISIYLNEMRYYIKKKNYTKSEKLCNTAKQLVLTMSKSDRLSLSSSEYNDLVQSLKPVILNHTYILREKQENINVTEKEVDDLNRSILKIIDEEYMKFYILKEKDNLSESIDVDVNDKSYKKIIIRKAHALYSLREYDKVVDYISKVKNEIISKEEFKSDLIFEEELENLVRKSKEMSVYLRKKLDFNIKKKFLFGINAYSQSIENEKLSNQDYDYQSEDWNLKLKNEDEEENEKEGEQEKEKEKLSKNDDWDVGCNEKSLGNEGLDWLKCKNSIDFEEEVRKLKDMFKII